MKHDLRIIGYITFTIFILLWINQLFSGIKLYETVKTRWQTHMDSIIASIIPPYVEILQTDSVQEQTPLVTGQRITLQNSRCRSFHHRTVRQHASSNRQVPKLQNTHVRHNTGKNLPDK